MKFCLKRPQSDSTFRIGEIRQVRGAQISMIFQEPMTALESGSRSRGSKLPKPFWRTRVSKQRGLGTGSRERDDKAVSIPDAEKRGEGLSASALGWNAPARHDRDGAGVRPELVIADEPTTALDVTIQAQILELLDSLREKYQLSLILISHDLGVIAEVAETVAVMYAGKIVEIGPAMDIFHNPKHPYTEGLLRSVPRLGSSAEKAEKKDRLYAIEGMVPNLLHLPDGCSFARAAIRERSNVRFPRFRSSQLINKERFVAFMPDTVEPLLSVQHLQEVLSDPPGRFRACCGACEGR